MASEAGLSTNARKLQDEEIERLVKCRVRSEIEARKAAEATMKRAVQEAREVKKELMILRQEKEEFMQDTKRAARNAATTPPPGGVATKDDLQKKLSHEKTKRKDVATQLEQTQREVQQLRAQLDERDAQLSQAQSRRDDQIEKVQNELKVRQREYEQLQEEAKKLKSAADEAKRKCQRAVKEKKEELQHLIDENEQISKRCEGLERLADENTKLRKLIEKTKEKQGGVAEEWQRRLDQREQAFLRQEQDNKQQLADKQREIEMLINEKDALVARNEDLEDAAKATARVHAAALEREETKFQELVASTKDLQERILTLKDAGRAADRARFEAETRLVKAEELRAIAEAAADAVESRAEKLETQLRDARLQLEQVEKALKKKGITIEFLIKSGASSSNGSIGNNTSPASTTSKVTTPKEPKGPEDNDEPTPPPKKKTISSTVPTPPVMAKEKVKATSETRTRVPPSVAPAKTLLTKSKPLNSARGERDHRDSNNNQTHADKEPIPERAHK